MKHPSLVAAVAATLGLGLITSSHAGYAAFAGANAAVRGAAADGYPVISPWNWKVDDGAQWTGADHASASASNGGSFAGKHMESSASSDLGTGTLKARALVSNTVSAPATQASAFAYAQAEFGDSFHFQNATGAPFAWAMGDLVTFRFHVDGTLWNQSTESGGMGFFLGLEIFSRGALDGTDGNIPRLGGGAWDTDGSRPLFSDSFGRIGMTLRQSGSLASGGWDLEATFAPGGDFDWYLSQIGRASCRERVCYVV